MSHLPCAPRYALGCVLLLAITLLSGCGAKQAERPTDRRSSSNEPVSGEPTETVLVEPLEREPAMDPVASEVAEIIVTDPALGVPSPTLGSEPSIAFSIGEAAAPMSAAPMSAAPMSAAPMSAAPMSAAPMSAAPMAAARAPRAAFPSARTLPAETTDPPDTVATSTGPFPTLPAGSIHESGKGFATIAVYYATDRQRDSLGLSSFNITGNRNALILLAGFAVVFLVLSLLNFWRKRFQVGIGFGVFGSAAAAGAGMILLSGTANIEKQGVTYNADRGRLVKGICKVTVPDTHERGMVERPSLLRFEVREDQQDHIVLTSAVELSDDDFQRRLAETVALSPSKDLLVFVHGYNVDFESAVQRTAQIAVDLPFEGVPVCYSWPSQGTLFGYTVDETNAGWTQTHLKQFLLELAGETGARSINVVAHSMGNRPTTGALVEIGWERSRSGPGAGGPEDHGQMFDRVVLAAPDVDADRFRRDLAPVLTQVANHVTLYASSDDQALIASKRVHGYPRAGESGRNVVVVPGIETVDVSGIDLSLLGHSYYGDNRSMLQDLYEVVRARLPAPRRRLLTPRPHGELTYWQLIGHERLSAEPTSVR